MNNKDKKFMSLAYEQAKKSKYNRFPMGCVIAYKGHVIGRGHNSNRTDPMQKHYNKKRKFNKTSGKPVVHSIHCEIAALKSIPYPIADSVDWSKVKVYIYRISKGHALHIGMARCCPACMQALRDKGIRKIYYTTNEGYAHEEIF